MGHATLRQQATKGALAVGISLAVVMIVAAIGLVRLAGQDGGFGYGLGAVFVLAAVVLVGVSAYAWRQVSSLIGLIERSRDVITQAAQGDLNVRIVRIGRRDEMGDMLDATNHLLDLTEEFAKDTGAAMKRAGAKEYFRYIPPQGLRGDFLTYSELINRVLADMEAREVETDAFEQSVKSMVANVATATQGIHRTAQIMADRSENAGGHSLYVGEAVGVTSELAQAVSDSTAQMASAINEIAREVGMSAQIAESAVKGIDETAQRMNGLAESVAQIGAVVQLINDIASQTNLLALNATIEAARAGAAGKGFAVVANEVKALANQTARATDDIARQVNAVQDAARLAAAGIGEVVDTIRRIDDISATIAGAVQEQEAVTREIAHNISEVADKAKQVSKSIIQTTQASAHACGGTVRVIWSARKLADVVTALDRRVNEYVSKVS